MAQYDSALVSKSKRNSRKFSDIDLNFTRNTITSDIIKVEDVIAVKRSVKNLVQTNFYERPFQPELGCGVPSWDPGFSLCGRFGLGNAAGAGACPSGASSIDR